MLRSINSALDLKRAEYDLEVVYADTEPLMAEEMRGCDDVSRESNGSAACDEFGVVPGMACRDVRGDCPYSMGK
jgi:hypothetical protein